MPTRVRECSLICRFAEEPIRYTRTPTESLSGSPARLSPRPFNFPKRFSAAEKDAVSCEYNLNSQAVSQQGDRDCMRRRQHGMSDQEPSEPVDDFRVLRKGNTRCGKHSKLFSRHEQSRTGTSSSRKPRSISFPTEIVLPEGGRGRKINALSVFTSDMQKHFVLRIERPVVYVSTAEKLRKPIHRHCLPHPY